MQNRTRVGSGEGGGFSGSGSNLERRATSTRGSGLERVTEPWAGCASSVSTETDPLLAWGLLEENLASNPTAGSTGPCGDIAAERGKGSERLWKSMFPGRGQSGSSPAKCWENVSKRWVKQSRHDRLVTVSQEFHSASLEAWPVNVLAQVDQRENPPNPPGLCLQAFEKNANLEMCANDKALLSIENSYSNILHVWSLKRTE